VCHYVLEEEEGAAGVLGEELPRVEAATGEGLLVAFTCGSDDRTVWISGTLLRR
jgi:hypothetical protein